MRKPRLYQKVAFGRTYFAHFLSIGALSRNARNKPFQKRLLDSVHASLIFSLSSDRNERNHDYIKKLLLEGLISRISYQLELYQEMREISPSKRDCLIFTFNKNKLKK